MLFYTIEQIPGKTYIPLGMVKGGIVQSKNIGKDIMAGFKTLVGGELKGYTEMMNEARAMATKRMSEEAENLGADAVVGIRYVSASVMAGAAEVVAYGTAVKFIGN
ncbi:MAG: heavy metal-binding domain-containing protein [Eubacteriales bacterium]